MRSIAVALLALLLTACSNGDDPAPPPPNAAPMITSPPTASVEENTADGVYAVTASDADGDPLTFSIEGGADADEFRLEGSNLVFASPPDFETPTDADADNVYEVTVGASDGAASTSLEVAITVTDLPEGFSVRRVASGLAAPVFVAGRGDGSGRIFVLEKGGQIEILDPETGILESDPFLDISSTITSDGERGLLGFALAPDFPASEEFYVLVTNLAGDVEVRRYSVSVADPDIANPASGDVILAIVRPRANHNAGWIGFGPDGFLYVTSGDSGGAGDPDDAAQDPTNLLGAVLRIDPSSDDFPVDPERDYAIPADNPFAASGGAPEVYAYGLRNPYRASFDRVTGDLYIGDVGQDAIEEIDLVRPGEAGLNFGWNILEGNADFAGGPTAGLAPPVAEYRHDASPFLGRSVTGGYVYRGPVGDLQGAYVFGDFISGNVFSVQVATVAQGATIASDEFTIRTDDFTPDMGTIDMVSSFGEDDAGNLYVVDFDGEIFRVE